MYVVLEKDGVKKNCKVGFSFTTLIFGPLVPLFRLDLLGLVVMLLVEALLAPVTGFIGSIAAWLIFPVFYNNWYVSRLKKNGWHVV